MRKKKNVVQPTVARIDVGLVAENIEPGGGEPAGGEGGDERIVINDVAAGGVDDDGALGKPGDKIPR